MLPSLYSCNLPLAISNLLQLHFAPCFIAIAPCTIAPIAPFTLFHCNCTLRYCTNCTLHHVSLQLHLPPLHQFHLAPCFIVIAPSTIAIAPWTAYHCNLQDQMGQLEQQELAFVWHPGTIQVWLSFSLLGTKVGTQQGSKPILILIILPMQILLVRTGFCGCV